MKGRVEVLGHGFRQSAREAGGRRDLLDARGAQGADAAEVLKSNASLRFGPIPGIVSSSLVDVRRRLRSFRL